MVYQMENRNTQERRFEFGKNWQQFLNLLDEERIQEAVKSLQSLFDTKDLNGQKFLDIGSGSGLFSLAARKLGAEVHSFDYDNQSVECTQELKKRYFPEDAHWIVEQGSVLDSGYLQSLGNFDIVYSYGVLHHTGAMWQALENVVPLIKTGGKLYIAIYNDQGLTSKVWKRIKYKYVNSNKFEKSIFLALVGLYFEFWALLSRLVRGESLLPFEDWAKKKKQRGMSVWHDLVDWVGGYPFEVAKPEQIFEFYKNRGFTLAKLMTIAGWHGNNEFVFIRPSDE